MLLAPPTLAVDSAQRDPVFIPWLVPPEAEGLSIAIGLYKRTLDHRPRHRAIVFPRLAMPPHLVLDYPSLRT
jgi:hypothetical protein